MQNALIGWRQSGGVDNPRQAAFAVILGKRLQSRRGAGTPVQDGREGPRSDLKCY